MPFRDNIRRNTSSHVVQLKQSLDLSDVHSSSYVEPEDEELVQQVSSRLYRESPAELWSMRGGHLNLESFLYTVENIRGSCVSSEKSYVSAS